MPELYLMRHGKSAWHTNAVSDFQRPLNPRGERDTTAMGKWWHSQRKIPHRIMSSSALRTWQTAVRLCTEIGIEEATVAFMGNLYMADSEELLAMINKQKKSCPSLLVIAHNPGLENLVRQLAAQQPLPGHDKLMPTASVAVFEVNDWQNVRAGLCRFQQIYRPKDIETVNT